MEMPSVIPPHTSVTHYHFLPSAIDWQADNLFLLLICTMQIIIFQLFSDKVFCFLIEKYHRDYNWNFFLLIIFIVLQRINKNTRQTPTIYLFYFYFYIFHYSNKWHFYNYSEVQSKIQVSQTGHVMFSLMIFFHQIWDIIHINFK